MGHLRKALHKIYSKGGQTKSGPKQINLGPKQQKLIPQMSAPGCLFEILLKQLE